MNSRHERHVDWSDLCARSISTRFRWPMSTLTRRAVARRAVREQPATPPRRPASRAPRLTKWIAPALIVILCVGARRGDLVRPGRARGLTNGWPLWRDDHPLYYHSALVTRAFLKDSWTTAGYDPYFMSGYAKSVVFPSSSTLPELVVALFGGDHPELAYKIYVLVSAAAVPWLIALACAVWRVPPAERAIAVAALD